jgi:tRNA(adenine34) deaminase
MRAAIKLAVDEKGTDPENAPIAAIIVKGGQEIARGVNRSKEDCDATAHAEIVAMREAGKALGNRDLDGATLYTTLQPCGMCTFAAIWAGITRIVFGARREDVHSMYFEDRHLSTLDFIADAYKEDLTLAGGVLAADCARFYFAPDVEIPEDEQANR